ncbi:MAG: peptide ABC transporter substrate-binding protein [Gammaproteobacteria bacterium]|nr:peptide ABC transporter substrate-binding protein [Gammaproteobacteria bacterium]NNC96981.1 peptide ABC transporter substrate-binding protein [Gammaproteobacteria bacterium]NNM13426.1 peptide ABC transporter substrate-binding protein [Gammaproteobacteria bacterium]
MKKLLTTSILALFLLVACGGNNSDSGEQSEKSASSDSGEGVVFHRGNGSEPDTLDPHRSEETSASEILRDVYEGLTTEDIDSNIVPGQAERWDITEDGKTYTFYLRENAKWSNGDPVVAQDFVAGMQRTVDPATISSYAQILDMIVNAKAVREGDLPKEALAVKAVSDKVLEVKLNAPTPYFLGLLNHSSTYPIHRASWAEYGDKFAKAGNMISNGAYTLDEWIVASHIKLVRNPHYYDNDNVQIDTVYHYPTEDISAELKRYRAGELDFTDQIPNNQFRFVNENLKDEFYVDPYLSTYYYVFDNTQAPFNDKRLRQALSMAIDRETIVEKVTGVGEIAAYGFVPPPVANYRAYKYAWADWPREKQIAEAQRLYAEAGYSKDNPLVTEIRYNTSENHKKVAVAISAMWKQVLGADIKLLNEEWKVFLQSRKNKDKWDIVRYGWVGDYNDAFTYAEIMHSTHGQNDSGFSNPEYDRLVEAAAVEGDLQKRADMLAEAEKIMLNDYPLMPIYFYVTKHLVKPHVKGFKSTIMDHNYSRHYRIEK